MRRIRRTLGRWLGTPLVAVLLGLSLALPLMESREGSDTPAVEREHSEATCVAGHDHRLCVLGGPLRTLLPPSTAIPIPHGELGDAAPAESRTLRPRIALSGTHSRAPPVTI
jgi:hypothetical protein